MFDITRELAVLSLVEDRTSINTALQAPAAPGMKKAVLRGALPAAEMLCMQTMARAGTAEDIVNIPKSPSELNDQPKFAFSAKIQQANQYLKG